MTEDSVIAEQLKRARLLASAAQDTAAIQAYLGVLRCDPTHFPALIEIGALAYASDHRSAARTAYEQAVRYHPSNPLGHVSLGNLLFKEGDLTAARVQYEAALAADADFPEAHQGLARVLVELSQPEAAEPHWQKGFVGRAIVVQRYRGTAPALPVLLLVSARGGNIPTQQILSDRAFAVTAVYTEFYDPAQELPPHAVVFNAIGDADLCATALTRADEVLARTPAPVINLPTRVRMTGRIENAERLAKLEGVITPAICAMTRSALLRGAGLKFPLLLRSPGFHTGQHFLRVERQEDLAAAVAVLPGEELLAIEYLDARGADGMTRKYRVMMIDGVLYPLHLAISADWKVHYFTSDMAANVAYRQEEQRFLDDMTSVLGPCALTALQRISESLDLDYGGIDFGLAPDGSVLLFEANAAMVVKRPTPDPAWGYRRAPIDRVLEAVREMLLMKASSGVEGPIVRGVTSTNASRATAAGDARCVSDAPPEQVAA
jgi:hypothetical protein